MPWLTLRLALVLVALALVIVSAIGKMPLWPAVLFTILSLGATLLNV